MLLRIEGPQSGERRLDAASCDELAQAAALILAVAMDPSTTVESTPTPTAADPFAPSPSAVPTTTLVRPPIASMPRRTSTTSIAIHGGVGLDAALWRPVGPSLALGVAVLGRGYRIDLVGHYATPTIVAAPSNASLQARTQQWSIGLGACGVPAIGARRRVELPLCAAIEAGALHARGRGQALVGRSNVVPWIAASAGPTLIGRVTDRIALSLGVDAIVMLARPRFVTDQGTPVVQPRRIGVRALAGVEFRFEVPRR